MRIYIHFKYVNELNTKLKFKMNLVKLNLNIHNLEMVSELIYETDKNLFGTFLDKNRTPAIKKLKKLILLVKIVMVMNKSILEKIIKGKLWEFLLPLREMK